MTYEVCLFSYMKAGDLAAWTQGIGSLLAVVAAFFAVRHANRNVQRQLDATRLHENERRSERLRSCWAAVLCEVETCAVSAQLFIKENIGAPAYRLPTIVYNTIFPELITLATLQTRDVRPLYEFFMNVQAMNRGIDFAHDERSNPDTDAFQKEAHRTMSKADVIRPGGAVYRDALAVIERYYPHGCIAKPAQPIIVQPAGNP